MSSNVYRQTLMAADAPISLRAEFIRKTYAHLGLAVLAFAGLSTVIVKTPALHTPLLELMVASPMSWLIVLGLFMVVGWIADRWARSAKSPAMQYAGLGLYIVAEAIIFTPLLYMAAYYTTADVLPTAGILTTIVFGGLTSTVFLTGKDFSFMRGVLMLVGWGAMGLIVISLLVGFSLGSLFSIAMVLLAAGYILYYTSNVLHHYPVGSHVAASLALFSAVALLFFYILRLVMAFGRD